jgi:hypothetical protein
MKIKILTGLFIVLFVGAVSCDFYNQPHHMEITGTVTSIEWVDGWPNDWVIENDEAKEARVRIEFTATGLDMSESISFDLTIDGETKRMSDAQFQIRSGETKTFYMVFDTGVYMDRPASSIGVVENITHKSVYSN